MKNQNRDLVGQFALAITVLGVGGYIVLSSGVFGGKSVFDDWQRTPKYPVVKSQEEITKKWKDEIQVIAQESAKKALEVEDLTSRLAAIRLEIKDRLSDLSRMSSGDGRSIRRPSVDALPSRFSSISHLHEYLRQILSTEVLRFEAQADSSAPGQSQLVSFDRPFAEDSVFLRPLGLRWAKAVSKAAVDLKAAALVIRYVQGRIGVERANVLRQYLQDQLESLAGSSGSPAAPRIELQAADPEQAMSVSKVDLLLKLSSMN
jgi:hypothetical protein